MGGREGGKKKPLKQPKKGEKFLDDDDIAFKNKQKDDQKRMAEAKKLASGKGAIGAGNKKLSKK